MAALRDEILRVEVQRRGFVGEIGQVACAGVRRRRVEEIHERHARQDPAATPRTGRHRRAVEATHQGPQRLGLLGIEHHLVAVIVQEAERVDGHPVTVPPACPTEAAAPGRWRTWSNGHMRAVTIVDGALRWIQHPDPVPGTGELLVAVRAAGLNGADMLQRAGLYPAPAGAPATIPGLELAGEVVATGPDVRRFAVGDRVMAVTGGGGQAELAVVHERLALAVPASLGWPEAGGAPEVFSTAHDALFTQCGVTLGERVLVHGAAGGVGIAGVQLAARAGAEVVATVRNPDLRDRVAEIGAACGSVEVCAPDEHGARGPFDVVLELVGGPNLAGDVEHLATGGRIAIIGVGGGARAELDLLGLMGRRGRIHGSTLRARSLEDKAAVARGFERSVLGLLERGEVRVPVEATLPMAEAEAAYDRFSVGGKLGKIVLAT